MSKKVLIFHDTFLMKGGAERMNIEMAKILDADIATTLWHPDCYNPREMGFQGKIFEMHPKFRRGMLGFLRMKLAFIFAKYGKFTEKHFYCENMQYENSSHQTEKKKEFNSSKQHLFHMPETTHPPHSSHPFSFDDYDTILFSNEAISAIWSTPKHITTLYYAHSISRHLFDLYESYLDKVPKFARIPYRLMAAFFRTLYRKELQRINLVLTNSPANVTRLKLWCQKDSEVLFPSVDTETFQPKPLHTGYSHPLDTYKNAQSLPSSFFLSFARVTKVKGIETIIRAFQQTPNQHILILFGMNDSDRATCMQLADISPLDEQNSIITSGTFPNISFLSLQNNSDLPHIIARATATICMSHQEDFGMVAIESMACGVPVIAPNEWGYKETILHEKTGILLPENSVEALIHVLTHLNSAKLASMSQDCRIRAEDFGLKTLSKHLKKYISFAKSQKNSIIHP